MDAFNIAYMLPSLVSNVGTGAFVLTFLPAYVRARDRNGQPAANQLYGTALLMLLGLLATTLIVLAGVAPIVLPRMASTFGPEKMALCLRMFACTLPVVVISALTASWGAILNASNRFGLSSASPGLTSASMLVAVVCFTPFVGGYSLPIGLLAGSLCEATLLGVALVRTGFPIVPRWRGVDAELWSAIHQYLPMVAGMLLQISSWSVDQGMAAHWLDSGSVSTLNYGYKIVGVAAGIGSGAMSTVLTPHFSTLAAARDWRGLDRAVRRSVMLTLGVGIPVMLVLMALSKPIVELLYHRGAFTDTDVTNVAWVQAALLFQVPFQASGILMVRTISALEGNRILFLGAAMNLLVDVVMNLVFMHYWGILGIALSTTTVFIVFFVFLYLVGGRLMARRIAETG